MSLHACPHCWETTCVCGNKYKDWTKEDLMDQIKMLVKLYNKKVKSKKSKLKGLTRKLFIKDIV